ncbi:MAG TPA: hypothetical protein VF690_12155 [Hymenobacter sp.]|jgi:hypothetical protein
MIQRLWLLLSLLCCVVTAGACQWVYKTVSLQLPDRYQGWILVVPVPDTLTAPVHRQGASYLVGTQGVVYLPASVMKDVKRYRIYQHGEDIEPLMQYAGVAVDHVATGDRDYVQFYLPPQANRHITSPEYWREQSVLVDEQKREWMEELVKSGTLRFYFRQVQAEK